MFVDVRFPNEFLSSLSFQAILLAELIEIGHEEHVEAAHSSGVRIQVAVIKVNESQRKMDVSQALEEDSLELMIHDIQLDQIENHLDLVPRCQYDDQAFDAAEERGERTEII